MMPRRNRRLQVGTAADAESAIRRAVADGEPVTVITGLSALADGPSPEVREAMAATAGEAA